jgi:hypothetical protein
MEAFWTLAGPVLMGLAAVGAVLWIKITRRRQATQSGPFGGAVPANPLSAADARRMSRRYGMVAGVLVLLIVLAAILASSAK